MSVQLLQTKLFIPPPHPNRVPRSRLIQRLGHRLTPVLDPAPQIRLLRNATYASCVDLPIIPGR